MSLTDVLREMKCSPCSPKRQYGGTPETRIMPTFSPCSPCSPEKNEGAQEMQKFTSCRTCAYRTPMQSCGVPVLAGLSERFEIRWHDQGGNGCTAWRQKQ